MAQQQQLMPDVTAAADMRNGLCTAMEGESSSLQGQVVVRARGEIGEVIKGVGEGMRGEVTSLLLCLQISSPFAALPPSCWFMFGYSCKFLLFLE